MASVCLYFQVHQPFRVNQYRFFDIGNDHEYFNDGTESSCNNTMILRRVAEKSYLPTNRLLLHLLKHHPEFRVSFSLSGVVLEQFEQYAPSVLESFQELAATGKVEFLGETYYHSLSFLYSKDEFRKQVKKHQQKVKKVLRKIPRVFRNTELIYNNAIAYEAEQLGFRGVLAEGADHILGWRSPNFLYRPVGTKNMAVMLKNYRLSDDIAFRFSTRTWKEYPLTTQKFAHWINEVNGNGQVVNLFMDYETFGEHQWADTGIFDFLKALPKDILAYRDNDFITPSEAIKRYKPIAELDVHHYVSWADTERDLSAWLSNEIQHDAINSIYALESAVLETNDARLIEDWRRLQTSDHFYYMCTKWFADGDVHKYFSPYDSPYEAFISWMNVLQDLKLRVYNKRQAMCR